MRNLIRQEIIKTKQKYLAINLIAYTEVIIGIILTLKYFTNNYMLTIANVLLVTSVILELCSLKIQHSHSFRNLLIQFRPSNTKTITINLRAKNKTRLFVGYLIFFFVMIAISYLFFHFFIHSIWTILLFLMLLNTVIDLKHLIKLKEEVK